MKRTLSLLGIILLLFTASACSGKKPLDSTAVKGQNILAVLKDMSQAYEKKNLDAFMAKVSDTYTDREAFTGSLTTVFTKYETIHFNIQYTKMLITVQEKGLIKAACNWDAEWITSGGLTQKGGGRVTFAYDPATFKLVAIEGKNPFIPTASAGK